MSMGWRWGQVAGLNEVDLVSLIEKLRFGQTGRR